MMSNLIGNVLAFVISFSFINSIQAQISVHKAASFFVGTFSNKQQADTSSSPLFAEQLIFGKRIWHKDKAQAWVYMSWFHPKDMNNPLDHRVFQLKMNEQGTIDITPYHIQPSKYSDNLDFGKLTPDDLISDVCVCQWKKEPCGYRMLSEQSLCESHVDGGIYKYIQMDFRFHKNGFSMYHQFFNDQNKLMFSYPQGSHFYKK